ncbi:MAG: hypothetical protein GQ545_10530 [Candidatus Aminicenantes bacterium]|nr:hypothetical protein [Candidatus Aminicenantes bacterium]
MTKKIVPLIIVCVFFIALSSGCQRAIPGVNENCQYKNIYTLDCGKDLLSGYPAKNRDGTVNVVVEIPAVRVASPELATMPTKRGLLNFFDVYAYNGFCSGEENRIYSHVLEFCKKLSDKVI